MTEAKSNRIEAIDILRGMTIAGMILVNNPGAQPVYTPLEHAEWIGLTPTDLVFPFFMFIMGITTYLSLRKFNFEWSWLCVRKILKRAVLLYLVGIAISWLMRFCWGMASPEDPSLAFFPRLWAAANTFDTIRLVGVFPRLALCYGLAALIAITLRHRYIPWLIATLFIGYFLLLEYGNGWAHDATNILAEFDKAVIGDNHLYKWDTPDPAGLLSTLPSLAHVLIGFCVGGILTRLNNINEKIERLFIIGALLTFAGFLLSYGCPISKKLWTPTFALVTCGLASTLLALLSWVIDKRHYQGRITHFFRVFGVNPLALYVLADILLIPFTIIPLFGKSLQDSLVTDVMEPLLGTQAASLAWALLFVLSVWACGYYLYKKKIFIKL